MGYGQGGYTGDIDEISAALDAGADIEGVTSTQGTSVSPVEQQVTFGGYPNQIGPSAISKKGLINKDPAWNTVDIINSLHPDFVANASPEELDYTISVVQGKAPYAEGILSGPPASVEDIIKSLHPDFVANASLMELDYAVAVAQGKAKYEEGAFSGPPVSRQPPWAGTRTQTTGTGQTGVEATVKEINKYEKAIKETEKSQAKIAKLNKQLQQQLDNMQRWYTSPARAEALLGPPRGSGGDVGAYIEQQQMGMGPPLGGGNMPTYSGTPTFVEDESAWGAGDYLGAPTFVEDESAWGAGSYVPSGGAIKDNKLGKITVPKGRDVPINTFEAWQDLVENTNQAWDYRGGSAFDYEKDTGKTNYGSWKGKFNNLTAKQNLENLHTFRKGWMTDFENKFGSAQHWGLTRPTVNGKQISWDTNRLRNQVMRTDEFLNAYDSVYGTSKGAKMIGNMFSKGVGTVGSMAQSFVNKKGAGNADKFDTTVKKVTSGEYGGGAEVQPQHPREKVSGGFWGLMSFAKENKKLFESLSGDELWALVSDPDEFWAFYEDALNAQ